MFLNLKQKDLKHVASSFRVYLTLLMHASSHAILWPLYCFTSFTKNCDKVKRSFAKKKKKRKSLQIYFWKLKNQVWKWEMANFLIGLYNLIKQSFAQIIHELNSSSPPPPPSRGKVWKFFCLLRRHIKHITSLKTYCLPSLIQLHWLCFFCSFASTICLNI